ncbi:hypothetical protein L1987_54854 [Smallanthus sonchifolius]|uniref:Uncharacterized protein n=1 Tax=Smallanthus sonchifolius TaxID=185202 RepID=A0ACB9E8M9_9ASTR|nr:hypothetical protein L1987_54854 [Smallanthus sonchifolius]
MHAREVYAQRAVLAKDLKELLLRVSGVLNEGRISLEISDELIEISKGSKLKWIVSYIHLSCTLTTMALYLVLFVRTITHLMSWLSCRT